MSKSMRKKHDLRNGGIALEFFLAQNNNFSRRSLADYIFCSLGPGARKAGIYTSESLEAEEEIQAEL